MRRRPLFLAFRFVLAALISVLMISPAQADIQSYNWIRAAFRGYDYFYGRSVTAYEEGSNATLLVSVYNNYWAGPPYWDYRPVNVSAVKVGFDWNINYSSTECSESEPLVIEPRESYVFTISFTVPATSVASNLFTHKYTIFVEHINSTTGPQKIVGTWTEDGYGFAVYSKDQADAQNLSQELAALLPFAPNFSSSKARVLWTEAQSEASKGSMYYSSGEFADAKKAFQTGLDKAGEALSTEGSMGKAPQMTQAFGWAFLGLGVLLLGAGAVIYGLKKPRI